jgi:CheY-like chemotaxis protein
MSYPRKLHILVIEDDADAIEAYKSSFALLAKTYQLVDPVFARSFADAKKHIDGSAIFHLVLLDLNLPMATRQTPVEGLAPGEQLLEDLTQRDSYPVPVVLVVSGKLNLAESIGGLQDRLAKDFWYGRLVNKGLGQESEIEVGMVQALRYIDVGIHIQDSGKEWFPTLSPREEDLIRRCVLSQSSILGVDVRWWSAEPGPSVSHPSTNRGPTKVLMGHFLMDDGMGTSIPTFFKFEPAGNSPSVCRDVGILAQKLGHVKVHHTAQSRQRSLIVTQSVTNQGWPVPLNEYLHQSADVVGPAIPQLIGQVVKQLNQVGGESEDEIPVQEFLWEYLDRNAIEKAWNGCDTRQLRDDSCLSPLEAFDHLKQLTAKIWATRRTCIHGDLNATNIAIDASHPENPQAYIFDAAGMKADFEFRDLATLEITTILFNSIGVDQQLFQACRKFYQDEFVPTKGHDPLPTNSFVENVTSLIATIRSQFVSEAHKIEYALLVFDASMRQLSGLGIQPSPNKIRNPLHACFLAVWAAQWLQVIAPELFQSQSGTASAAEEKHEEAV